VTPEARALAAAAQQTQTPADEGFPQLALSLTDTDADTDATLDRRGGSDPELSESDLESRTWPAATNSG
jgi:hypothetical protein